MTLPKSFRRQFSLPDDFMKSELGYTFFHPRIMQIRGMLYSEQRWLQRYIARYPKGIPPEAQQTIQKRLGHFRQLYTKLCQILDWRLKFVRHVFSSPEGHYIFFIFELARYYDLNGDEGTATQLWTKIIEECQLDIPPGIAVQDFFCDAKLVRRVEPMLTPKSIPEALKVVNQHDFLLGDLCTEFRNDLHFVNAIFDIIDARTSHIPEDLVQSYCNHEAGAVSLSSVWVDRIKTISLGLENYGDIFNEVAGHRNRQSEIFEAIFGLTQTEEVMSEEVTAGQEESSSHKAVYDIMNRVKGALNEHYGIPQKSLLNYILSIGLAGAKTPFCRGDLSTESGKLCPVCSLKTKAFRKKIPMFERTESSIISDDTYPTTTNPVTLSRTSGNKAAGQFVMMEDGTVVSLSTVASLALHGISMNPKEPTEDNLDPAVSHCSQSHTPSSSHNERFRTPQRYTSSQLSHMSPASSSTTSDASPGGSSSPPSQFQSFTNNIYSDITPDSKIYPLFFP